MPSSLPRTLTVIRDSNEQRPLLFPANLRVWEETVSSPMLHESGVLIRIKTKKQRLPVGDYRIEEFGDIVGVERKGSIDELLQNTMTRDRTRFLKALSGFIGTYRYPILYIDMIPGELWKPHSDLEPWRAIDRLFGTISLAGVDVLWGTRKAPTPAIRRRVGELVLRRMIHRYLAWSYKEKSDARR